MEILTKTCLTCGKIVRGRTDKKFCDDYCRNNYNNQLKAGDNNFVRNINNALRKNRRILTQVLPPNEESVRTTRRSLAEQGFRFNYMTHTTASEDGDACYFCYDYGYTPVDKDWLMIVRQREVIPN